MGFNNTPSEASVEEVDPFTLFEKGESLYASKNCAACHGSDVETSLKRGASASKLINAVAADSPILVMRGISLDADELKALIFALNNERPSRPNNLVQSGLSDALPLVDASIYKSCNVENRAAKGQANHSLRKLDKEELLNSVKRIFNNVYDISKYKTSSNLFFTPLEKRDPVQIALNDYPDDYSAKPGEEFQRAFNFQQMVKWMDVVDGIATVAHDRNKFELFVSQKNCTTVALTEACFKEFVVNFGKKAFRRPLLQSEVDSYMDMMTLENPLHSATKRFLMSPDFMFQVREGLDQNGERVRLSQYEIASLISYRISANMPDDELMAAADNGELRNTNQLEYHVRRLLDDQSAKDKSYNFIDGWVGLSKVTDSLNNAVANYVQVPSSAGSTNYNGNNLGLQFKREARAFVDYILWDSDGGYQELMTEKVSVPQDIRVAHVYGVSYNDGGPVATPDHPGLLTRGAFLGTLSDVTNPIKRGVTLMDKVLCEHIPSPDFSVIDTREGSLGSEDPVLVPNHTRVSRTTGSAACMACHTKINAYGFILEEYSPIGHKWDFQDAIIRTYESSRYGVTKPTDLPVGVNTFAAYRHELPQAQTVAIDENQNRSIASTEQLLSEVVASDRAPACFATRVFRYYNRRAEAKTDSCTISEMIQNIKNNKSIKDVIVEMVVDENINWRKAQ